MKILSQCYSNENNQQLPLEFIGTMRPEYDQFPLGIDPWDSQHPFPLIQSNAMTTHVSFGINEENPFAVGVRQEHTAKIVSYQKAQSQVIEADGLSSEWDQSKGTQVLRIKTADCLAIAFAMPHSDSVCCAIVHAGWRGFTSAIHLNALDIIRSSATRADLETSKAIENTHVIISPAIFGETYPCGEDVFSALMEHKKSRVAHLPGFAQIESSWHAALDVQPVASHDLRSTGDRKYYPDLQLLACCELLAAGVPSANITVIRENTFVHSKIPSYRRFCREHPNGRFRGSLFTQLIIQST